MFQFSGFACLAAYHIFNMVGCPIRISADRSVCASPRSFSQLITSFIASESLGIPHTLLCSLLYILSFNEFATVPKLVNRERLPVTLSRSENRNNNIFLCIFFQYVNERLDTHFRGHSGGEYRSRTDDLLRARQAL